MVGVVVVVCGGRWMKWWMLGGGGGRKRCNGHGRHQARRMTHKPCFITDTKSDREGRSKHVAGGSWPMSCVIGTKETASW